jgi:hypothetical protein
MRRKADSHTLYPPSRRAFDRMKTELLNLE